MINSKLILTVGLLLCGACILYAQPTGPSGSPTPLGGGALLAAAAAIYGGKKAYDKSKQEQK